MYYFVPESPLYLFEKAKFDQLEKSFIQMAEMNGVNHVDKVEMIIRKLKNEMRSRQNTKEH